MECSNKVIKVLIKELKNIIEALEDGNSNLSDDELQTVLDTISNLSNKEQRMSRTQAAQYLNINIKTFDNRVKEGRLPCGKKELGLKEKTWIKKELDKFIS